MLRNTGLRVILTGYLCLPIMDGRASLTAGGTDLFFPLIVIEELGNLVGTPKCLVAEETDFPVLMNGI